MNYGKTVFSNLIENVIFNGVTGPVDYVASGGRNKMQFSIMNTQGNLAGWVDVGSSQANTIHILRDVQWPDGTYGV